MICLKYHLGIKNYNNNCTNVSLSKTNRSFYAQTGISDPCGVPLPALNDFWGNTWSWGIAEYQGDNRWCGV